MWGGKGGDGRDRGLCCSVARHRPNHVNRDARPHAAAPKFEDPWSQTPKDWVPKEIPSQGPRHEKRSSPSIGIQSSSSSPQGMWVPGSPGGTPPPLGSPEGAPVPSGPRAAGPPPRAGPLGRSGSPCGNSPPVGSLGTPRGTRRGVHPSAAAADARRVTAAAADPTGPGTSGEKDFGMERPGLPHGYGVFGVKESD